MVNKISSLILLIAVFSLCINCTDNKPDLKNNKLTILATTTIVADVIQNICADAAYVESLLPPGASPHSFNAIPRDIAKIDQADLFFIHGGGLEQSLEKLINQPDIKNKTISLSEHIDFLHAENSEHPDEHDHGSIDPHVWMDPHNVIIWVNTIKSALCEKDSVNCDQYKKNADIYRMKLIELDAWIANQFQAIDENNRKIVTDHRMLGYFGHRYGLQQVGTILPGFSSLAEPSAREIARLEDQIKQLKLTAVLIGINMNPALAERITQDTGTKLIRFYTGSLSEKGGAADTYIKYMQFNTQAILKALN
ncbi:zinc ABC transporter substrate-binding protein [candidate division KSB1 bacterium]|nr:zinc ABC transporter substrate-binding protein [candidate division KSB1 bacterium]